MRGPAHTPLLQHTALLRVKRLSAPRGSASTAHTGREKAFSSLAPNQNISCRQQEKQLHSTAGQAAGAQGPLLQPSILRADNILSSRGTTILGKCTPWASSGAPPLQEGRTTRARAAAHMHSSSSHISLSFSIFQPPTRVGAVEVPVAVTQVLTDAAAAPPGCAGTAASSRRGFHPPQALPLPGAVPPLRSTRRDPSLLFPAQLSRQSWGFPSDGPQGRSKMKSLSSCNSHGLSAEQSGPG